MHSLLKNLVALTTSHWLVMTGAVMASAGAVVFVSLYLLGLGVENPYFGILLLVVLPAFFALGLVFIAIGLHRRARQLDGYREILHVFSWEDKSVLRLVAVLTVATVLNVVLLATAGYEGMEYLDSDTFCGGACHAVMEPQYTAYQDSAHARVGCVRCHVGPGLSSFFRNKTEGARRLVSFALRDYRRPIPSSGGRPTAASETCGGCHRDDGAFRETDALRMIYSYDQDVESTQRVTTLLIKVSRIHSAHLSNDIRFVAEDETLQSIPWFSSNGTEYLSGEKPDGPERRMDCIDCHNRVGHPFDSLEVALDRAIQTGLLDRAEPFAKRNAIEALNGETSLQNGVEQIQARNVFPAMAVDWDTYPDNRGHERFPGCFRCHDYEHMTDSGQVLEQDCGSCHDLIDVRANEPSL